ncbi:MAG TPA: hypothetical protein VGZ93_02970 [Candidatus Methylacidiphilales bacterium]|jgi:hypothetical protein|nr:hypothetical protein [Candidatus Methylacidiphilales bacterium]
MLIFIVNEYFVGSLSSRNRDSFVKTPLILLITLLGFVYPAYAQAPSLPKIITDGFDAYKKEGASKALDVWLAGSPIENDSTSRSTVVGSLQTIESAYGKFSGYEHLGTVSFARSTKRYYFVILYEKGPLYAWFEVYKTGGKEIIPSFDCNTKAPLILPESFFKKDNP